MSSFSKLRFARFAVLRGKSLKVSLFLTLLPIWDVFSSGIPPTGGFLDFFPILVDVTFVLTSSLLLLKQLGFAVRIGASA